MEFLKSVKLLALLASLLWKVGGAAPLKKWVGNGVEILERTVKASENQMDDAFVLPGVDLIRSEFGLPDIPDDQPLDWSIDLNI